jgi:hypothetical protein
MNPAHSLNRSLRWSGCKGTRIWGALSYRTQVVIPALTYTRLTWLGIAHQNGQKNDVNSAAVNLGLVCVLVLEFPQGESRGVHSAFNDREK